MYKYGTKRVFLSQNLNQMDSQRLLKISNDMIYIAKLGF